MTGKMIHTGQLFVDDNLNEVIDKVSQKSWLIYSSLQKKNRLTPFFFSQIHPYSINPIRNKWGRTRNWVDSLQVFQEASMGGYQPTFDIEKIGGVLQQGLIGYITIGVDLSADYDRGSTEQGNGVAHKKK